MPSTVQYFVVAAYAPRARLTVELKEPVTE